MELLIEILKENWGSIGVAIFLSSMVLYGHYVGFVRLVIPVISVLITLVIVHVSLPYVTTFIRNNEVISNFVSEHISSLIEGQELVQEVEELSFIEGLQIPDTLKEVLIENNNNEVYQNLGVEHFIDYIASSLVSLVVGGIGAVILFILVYIIVRIILRWLDLVTRFPVLSGMNQLAGAALGGIQGLLILWIFYLVIAMCSDSWWASESMKQINGSTWLRFLYDRNVFVLIWKSILKIVL